VAILYIFAGLFVITTGINLYNGDFENGIACGVTGILLIGLIFLFRREDLTTTRFVSWLKIHKENIYNERARYNETSVLPSTVLAQYQVVFSFVIFTTVLSSRMLIDGTGSASGYKYGFSLITLLFGWWGFPWGPIQTLRVLIRNMRGGQKVTVHEMIHFGGPRPKVKKMPPLVKAAYQNNMNKVVKLVDRGVDIHSKDPKGRTALLRAAEIGNIEMMEFLLENGADLQDRDIDGDTVLIRAAVNGNGDAVTLLLRRGVNVNEVNFDGDSSLTHAASRGYTHVVKLLLEGGADPNLANHRGGTALMLASVFNEKAAAQLLLNAGARIDAADENGITAMAIALARGHLTIVDMFKQKQGVSA
jgi:ankyrin repeat protein